MRVLAVVCIMVFVVTSATLAQPPADSAHLITPGVGIGPIRLGMVVSDVIRLLGMPRAAQVLSRSRVLSRAGATAFYWPNSKLLVEADGAGVVYDIATLNDSRCITADGLHDGLSPADIQEKWGPPSRIAHAQTGNKLLVYDSRGVTFFISRNGTRASKIVRIDVFTPMTQLAKGSERLARPAAPGPQAP